MLKTVHMVGISGAGMTALAKLFAESGIKVTGTDFKPSKYLKSLSTCRIFYYTGQKAKNGELLERLIGEADAVVYSAAVRSDHPELILASSLGVPIFVRAEALQKFLNPFKFQIGVAGSHGKGSTTALIWHMLRALCWDPGICIGAVLKDLEINAWLGHGDCFVYEADESDGYLKGYNSKIAVITNVDFEHVERFSDLQTLEYEYVKFLRKIPDDGFAVCPANWPGSSELSSLIQAKSLKFGSLKDDADVRVQMLQGSEDFCTFKVVWPEGQMLIDLPFLSVINADNLAAACCVIFGLGLDIERAVNSLVSFFGLKRRLEKVFDEDGVILIDDYAHHPTEIRSVLKELSCVDAYKLCVLEPHKYSRLSRFFDDFVDAFSGADEAIITDVYSAGESPIQNIDSDSLANCIKIEKNIFSNYTPMDTLVDVLGKRIEQLRSLDKKLLVVFMGAGAIYRIVDEVKNKLQGKKSLSD